MKQTLTEILEKLVSFESISTKPDQILACREYIKSLFDERFVIKEFEHKGKYSIVISTEDKKEFDIILNGHFDVVPGNPDEFTPQIKGSRMYGRGTSDMKGTVAAMIYAMLQQPDSNNGESVGLMLTGDEELGGFDGVEYLLQQEGYRSKYAFVPDAGSNFDIVTGEKGVFHFDAKAKGVPAHGSRPWLGENAIEKLFSLYKKLAEMYPIPQDENRWDTSINLGTITGGDARNKVPAEATMGIDMRFTEKYTFDALVKEVKDVCDEFGVEIEVKSRGACLFTPEDDPTLTKLKAIIEKRGLTTRFTKEHGATDGRFFADLGTIVVMVKPSSSQPHIDNEWVDLDSLTIFTEILLELLGQEF